MAKAIQDIHNFFEKYHEDNKLTYRLRARSLRYLGIWAAEKLFLFGQLASDYSVALVMFDHEHQNNLLLEEKIKKDLTQEDVLFCLDEYYDKFFDILHRSEQEILSEPDIYS